MKRAQSLRFLMAAVLVGGLPGIGQAAMGDNATTFGLLPADMATAQSLSLFGDQVSTTWYNPASLTRGPEGELTGGLFHTEPSLEVESHGGTNAPTRRGKVLNDTRSQAQLIGMKKDLSDLTRYDHPVYFGFMAGIEQYGKDLMAFESKTAEEGQFFNYGRQPLFLALGGGTNLWRGIDAGLSLRLTLESDATMETRSDLAGNTEKEDIEVHAEPRITPVLGFNVRMGETFCSRTPCALDKLDMALVFRGESRSQTNVDANAVIPGTVPEPGLDLIIETLDSYQPPMASLAGKYQWGAANIGLTAEFQAWSELEDELEDDVVKDQANLKFDDIVIPRLGVEYKLNDHMTLRSGAAWEESPLKSRRSEEVNYMDNDRVVFGLGGSMEISEPPILAYPIRLDFGYQYHHLRDRDFTLSGTNQNGDPYEERVTAGGEVHAVSGSFTVKF